MQELEKLKKAIEEEESDDNEKKKIILSDLDTFVLANNNRYFINCLVRSIGAVSAASFDKKLTSIVPVWNILRELKVPEWPEYLFGVLLQRFTKNLIGQSVMSVSSSQLIADLESFVSLNNKVASGFIALAQESQASDGSLIVEKEVQIPLGREFIESIQSRIIFLVEKVINSGELIEKIDSPFISPIVLDRSKLSIYRHYLTDIIIHIRNIIESKSEAGNENFYASFKSWISEALENSSSNDEEFSDAIAVIKLIRYFVSSKKRLESSLQFDTNKQLLNRHAELEIRDLIDQLPKYHKTSSMLEKRNIDLLKIIISK